MSQYVFNGYCISTVDVTRTFRMGFILWEEDAVSLKQICGEQRTPKFMITFVYRFYKSIKLILNGEFKETFKMCPNSIMLMNDLDRLRLKCYFEYLNLLGSNRFQSFKNKSESRVQYNYSLDYVYA